MTKMNMMWVVAAAVVLGAPALAQDTTIKTKTGEVGAPPVGKAEVVFFRPGSLMGAALGCTVHDGDAEVARLGSGKYYVVIAEPGKHDYYTKGEKTDTLHMELEGDETYFVKCKIGMGIVAGRANLSPSDRETFAKKAKGLAMWKGPKDDGDKSDKADGGKSAAAD